MIQRYESHIPARSLLLCCVGRKSTRRGLAPVEQEQIIFEFLFFQGSEINQVFFVVKKGEEHLLFKRLEVVFTMAYSLVILC